jgi:hypothetical protein
MYGNPGWSFLIDTQTGAWTEDQGESVYSEDGVFRGGKHRYGSAVIVLSRRTHAVDFRDRWTTEHMGDFASIEELWERGAAAPTAALEDPFYANAEEHFPGHYYAVRVVSTVGTITGEAVPVPLDLFDAEHDEYWSIDAATGRLAGLHCVAAIV